MSWVHAVCQIAPGKYVNFWGPHPIDHGYIEKIMSREDWFEADKECQPSMEEVMNEVQLRIKIVELATEIYSPKEHETLYIEVGDFYNQEKKKKETQYSLKYKNKNTEQVLTFHTGETLAILLQYILNHKTLLENEAKKFDMVNHPAHYGGEDNPLEVIKILEYHLTPNEFKGFCIGNAIKYLLRMKDCQFEDYKKCRWYVNHYIEQVEKKDAESKALKN